MPKDIGKHSSEEKTRKANKHLTIFNITGDQRTYIMTQRDTMLQISLTIASIQDDINKNIRDADICSSYQLHQN